VDTILGILRVKSYYDIHVLADLFYVHPQVSTSFSGVVAGETVAELTTNLA
jgi:hypothetical protein